MSTAQASATATGKIRKIDLPGVLPALILSTFVPSLGMGLYFLFIDMPIVGAACMVSAVLQVVGYLIRNRVDNVYPALFAVFGGWISPLWAALFLGGLTSFGSISTVASISIGGVVLGWRKMIPLAVLSGFVAIVMALYHEQIQAMNIMPETNMFVLTQTMVVFILLSVLLGTGLISEYFERTLRKQREDAQESHREAEEKYQQSRRELEEKELHQAQMALVKAQEVEEQSRQIAREFDEHAFAVEALTASINNVAHKSKLAEQISGRVKKLTSQGNEVGAAAKKAMDRIKTTGETIGEFSRVINDISFQTNLLSLNAMVEAARAGDAGKGFAVVASEVQALASKASNAASQIANLKTEEETQLLNGISTVSEATETLGEIDIQVSEVAKMMAELAGYSDEQATAIDQVNAANRSIHEKLNQVINAADIETAYSVAGEHPKLRVV